MTTHHECVVVVIKFYQRYRFVITNTASFSFEAIFTCRPAKWLYKFFGVTCFDGHLSLPVLVVVSGRIDAPIKKPHWPKFTTPRYLSNEASLLQMDVDIVAGDAAANTHYGKLANVAGIAAGQHPKT